MQCPSCAASYDDAFKFCPYCGNAKPEPATIRVKVEEPKWEYLQIEEKEDEKNQGFLSVLASGSRRKAWFEASAGLSLIAESLSWEYIFRVHGIGSWSTKPKDLTPLKKNAKQTLIDELETQGWEPILNDKGEINAMRRRKE